jgi:hypothetical protein
LKNNAVPKSFEDFKPKFIMWDEQSWRADRTVSRWSSRQRAFYRNLLMECYVGNDRPYLTMDDSLLWMIAEADNIEDWVGNKAPILTKFTEVVRGSDGQVLYSNKRVVEVWNRLEGGLKQKQNAGLASATARRKAVSDPHTPKQKKKTEQNTRKEKRTEYNRALSSVERPSTGVEHMSTSVEPPQPLAPEGVDQASEPATASLSFFNLDGPTKVLTDLLVQTAVLRSDGAACFTTKAKMEIARIIKEVAPTDTELVSVTNNIVGRMDDFQLRNAGSQLAASLAGYLAARKEVAAAEAAASQG